jgi:DNA-binding FadR family transcriptional regulator
VRRLTSDGAEVQGHAIRLHQLVLKAIESGVPAKARQAMSDHMTQIAEDYETYFSSAFNRAG